MSNDFEDFNSTFLYFKVALTSFLIYNSSMKKFLPILFSIIIIAFSLSGCAKSYSEDLYGLFGADGIITFNCESKDDFNDCYDEIYSLFAKYNVLTATYGDNIKAINNLSVNTPLTVNSEFFDLLSTAKNYYEFTNGYFNPAVYSLTVLWNFSTDTYKGATATYQLPTQSQIDNAKTYTNFNDVVLDANNTITKTNDVILDVGGVAKGYALNLAKSIVNKYGFTDGYISLGTSSILLFGEHKVAIRHPKGTGVSDTYLNFNVSGETAIATSGDYQRYYHIDGTKYCHIINPFTAKPIETGAISVTIVGEDAGICDALSTAIMAMDKQTAVDFINEKLSNYSVFIAYNDNTIITNATCGYEVTDKTFTVANTIENDKIIL